MSNARPVDDAPHDDPPRDRATMFHMAGREEWEAAATDHAYAPGAYAAESFVHCSYREQLAGVYQRYYAGRDDLVVLEIDRKVLESLVGAALVIDEASAATGERFPHVYAPLPHAAVRVVRDLDWFR